MVESKKLVMTHITMGTITKPTKKIRLGRRKRYADRVSLRANTRLLAVPADAFILNTPLSLNCHCPHLEQQLILKHIFSFSYAPPLERGGAPFFFCLSLYLRDSSHPSRCPQKPDVTVLPSLPRSRLSQTFQPLWQHLRRCRCAAAYSTTLYVLLPSPVLPDNSRP